MPRLAGIDIPEKKKIYFALQYIYGIGPKFAKDILTEAGIDVDRRANTLTDQEVSSIATVIDGGYIVEGALRRQTSQHIQRLRDIKSYRGERHRKGLPTRGQRTRSNARTRKGRKKTVAGKKGVKG
ncbi:MAG TPA: 30S ribosomal protein S13 [Phycisphaerales bacterium]|jgi:small subunit ribosomal protein S13|nr:30S ribosomal protein S13 [Phycisphaerales bacterium]